MIDNTISQRQARTSCCSRGRTQVTFSRTYIGATLLVAILCSGPTTHAATSTKMAKPAPPDASVLTLDRIFSSSEFEPQQFSGRWSADGARYIDLEKADEGGHDIVRYDPSGKHREVVVPAAMLVPSGESSPLVIEDFAFSKDRSRVLIYTNSKRVWRTKTRGDYWVLDRTSRQLWKLGGPDARPSTLMFATFSPDGRHVAYVRQRSLYVEDLRNHTIRPLAVAASETTINGTFDWVYEEEFSLRKGFRWSPDSKAIAYWQLDTSGVRQFPLVNDTDSLYPRITWIRYPKAGTQNSACRVGVVRLEDGQNNVDASAGRCARSLHCPHGLGGRFQSPYCPAIQPSAEQLSRYVGGGQHRERSNGTDRNGPGLGRRG